MDKRTLLAVVLSVVIIIAGSFLMQVFMPRTSQPSVPTTPTEQTTGQQPPSTTQSPETGSQAPTGPAQQTGVVPAPESAENPASDSIVRETGVFRITFSRIGGLPTSIQLKDFKNPNGTPVDMVLSGNSGQYPFEVSFGDYQQPWTTAPFDLKEIVNGDISTFEFSRTFLSVTKVPFVLRKTYVFHKNDYLMEFDISIENSVNDVPALQAGPFAYTLSFGPQIGPPFLKLDSRNEYRSFIYYAGGKRNDLGMLSGQFKDVEINATWVGIVGKYFTDLVIPDATHYSYVFDARRLSAGTDRSTLFVERPPLQGKTTHDEYRLYLGPKTRQTLGIYNDAASNSFATADLHLDDVITSPFLIGWFAKLLNWILDKIYVVIPNYGVAIILLTLLIKIVFLPLTFKRSQATARMQSLNPKIAELRAKYKDKPDKMNQEMMELYRKEGVNPLSGCLPMLLQLPVLWAIYSMLNDNFALRGALFIPGWINDLSSPESILSFGFTIPILGWTALRLLPFIMVGTQFLTTRVTTPPDSSQQGAQMKLMTYLLPAIFFFILYDMPSGLVLYWSIQNILSIFQQLYINDVNRKRKLAAAKVEPQPRARRR